MSNKFSGFENPPIASDHVDLDSYHPIRASCEFIFPKLPGGGAIVFDDYDCVRCPGGRQAVDEYFAGRIEKVFSLPTGQALVVKLR